MSDLNHLDELQFGRSVKKTPSSQKVRSEGKNSGSLLSSDFALTVNVPAVAVSYLVLLKVWPF